MNRTDPSTVLRTLLPVVSGLLILVVWYAVRILGNIEPYVLPTPGEILQAAWAERVRLLGAAGTTMQGALLGFLGAAIIGFGVALILASSKSVRFALYPHVLVVQMFPVIVLAPIFVLWVGPGLPSVARIAFLIGFFPVVANATQGLISTDANLVDLFRMANAGRLQEMFLLRVPYALPHYLTGLRIAASLAMIGAIAGEFFAGNSAGGTGGLGFMVIIYFAQLKTAALFATGFMACLCGFVFVSAVVGLNWLLLRKWHDSFDHADR
ncbi:MAG: ABC transporter permease [Opitutaceae bacterium]